MRICSIEGCGGKHHVRGWCRLHYNRWERSGDPNCGDRRSKGGIRDHPMYGAWGGMINRCENPNNSSYPRYGGAGVSVCERWHDFRNFLADMGERPPGKTLDRINTYGNYEPNNCRWATASEQRRNKTVEGDARMRQAMSNGVKQRWERLRAEGFQKKPKHPPPQPRRFHDKACEWCKAAFVAVRSDARFCSVRCGMTASYRRRFAPDHFKDAAKALE